MKVYVVSLIESSRRLNISNELRNIPFQYLDAVYGKDLGEKYVETINSQQWVKERYKRALTYGEIGCSLSHLKIYKDMLDKDIPWAIIFEDDISVKSPFYDVLLNNIDKFNPNDLYILGAQEGLACNDYVILSNKNSINLNDFIKFNKTIDSERYIYRTAAYLISKKVAENILNFTEKKFCLADDWSCFKKHNLFNELYMSDFISHPVDLNHQSLLELERSSKMKKNWKSNNPVTYEILKKFYIGYRKFKNFGK